MFCAGSVCTHASHSPERDCPWSLMAALSLGHINSFRFGSINKTFTGKLSSCLISLIFFFLYMCNRREENEKSRKREDKERIGRDVQKASRRSELFRSAAWDCRIANEWKPSDATITMLIRGSVATSQLCTLLGNILLLMLMEIERIDGSIIHFPYASTFDENNFHLTVSTTPSVAQCTRPNRNRRQSFRQVMSGACMPPEYNVTSQMVSRDFVKLSCLETWVKRRRGNLYLSANSIGRSSVY